MDTPAPRTTDELPRLPHPENGWQACIDRELVIRGVNEPSTQWSFDLYHTSSTDQSFIDVITDAVDAWRWCPFDIRPVRQEMVNATPVRIMNLSIKLIRKIKYIFYKNNFACLTYGDQN